VQGAWGRAEVSPVKRLWDDWLALEFSACWLAGQRIKELRTKWN